jgi:hypothetical protein
VRDGGDKERVAVAEFSLTRSTVADGGMIPPGHTGDGEDRAER